MRFVYDVRLRNRKTGFKCPRGCGKGTRFEECCRGKVSGMERSGIEAVWIRWTNRIRFMFAMIQRVRRKNWFKVRIDLRMNKRNQI